MLLYIQYPSWLHPELFPGVVWLGFLRWYSLSYIIAFAVAYQLFNWILRRDTPSLMSREQSADFGLLLMVCMIIGGRLGYVFIYDPAYYFSSWRSFLTILLPFSFEKDARFAFTGISGLSYHGGVLGVVLSLILTARRNKISFWKLADRLLPCLALAYTFGRLGNFANQELYGKVTAVPWGMLFSDADRVLTSENWAKMIAEKVGMVNTETGTIPSVLNLPRHPSQLYESFFEGIFLGAILLFIAVKWKDFAPGFISGCYLFGYGFVRFFIEYVREPDPHLGFIIKLGPGAETPQVFTSLLNLSMGQILCMAMMISGGIIMAMRIIAFRKQSL